MKKGVITEKIQRVGSACKRPETSKLPGVGPDGCTSSDHSLAGVFKAMAHPVRIRILHLLAASESSLCSCEIEARFPLRQPTISHHMKLLKEAGLVNSRQEGNWVHYEIPRNLPVPLNEILKMKK